MMKKLILLFTILMLSIAGYAQSVTLKKSQSLVTVSNTDHSDDYPSNSIRFYYNAQSATILNIFTNQVILNAIPYSKIYNADVIPQTAFTDSTSLKTFVRSGFFVKASDTTGIAKRIAAKADSVRLYGTVLPTKLNVSSNLSDVATAATALNNIGGIGAATTNVLTNKTFVNAGTPAPVTNIIEAWGDSRTQGVTVIATSPSTDHPYPATLAALSGYTVNNHGVAGYTTTQVMTAFLAQTSTQLSHPQIIWCGYNDLTTGTIAQFDTIEAHIARMVAIIPHSSYIIIGEDPDWSNPVSSQNLYGNYQTYNTYMARKYGAHFFNVNQYLLARYNRSSAADIANVGVGKLPPSLSVDGVHETPAGYDTIANGLYKHINVLDFKAKSFTPDYPKHELRTSNEEQGSQQRNSAAFDNVKAFSIALEKDGNIRQGGNIVFRSDSTTLGTIVGSLNGPNYLYSSTVTIPTIFGEGNLPIATGNYPLVYGWDNYTSLTSGSNNGAFAWAGADNVTSCTGCFVMGYNLNLPSATGNGQIDFFNALYIISSSYSGSTLNTGKMGLMNQAPNSTVSIGGSLSTTYSTQTGTYAITALDHVINCTSGTFTATLPTAAVITGREYIIKNSGTGAITVATTSSQTIDGSTTYSLPSQYKYVEVQSNGANWIIIGNN